MSHGPLVLGGQLRSSPNRATLSKVKGFFCRDSGQK